MNSAIKSSTRSRHSSMVYSKIGLDDAPKPRMSIANTYYTVIKYDRQLSRHYETRSHQGSPCKLPAQDIGSVGHVPWSGDQYWCTFHYDGLHDFVEQECCVGYTLLSTKGLYYCFKT